MGEIFPRARPVITAFDHRFGYTLGHGRDTNRSMLQYRPEAMKIAAKGEARVLARPNCVAALAALTTALSVVGCADNTTKWFVGPNPFNTTKGGYTYSSLGETRQERPITQNDLIDANGACPNYVPAAPSASANPGAGAPAIAGHCGAARRRRRSRHERMRCGHPVGPTNCGQSRQQYERIAQPDLDLQVRSAAGRLSVRGRPPVGNGSGRSTARRAGKENDQEKAGNVERAAKSRRQVVAGTASKNEPRPQLVQDARAAVLS